MIRRLGVAAVLAGAVFTVVRRRRESAEVDLWHEATTAIGPNRTTGGTAGPANPGGAPTTGG
jgi:hypothetical protein